MQDAYSPLGLWDEQGIIESRRERFVEIVLRTGDTRRLQCRPSHRETKPHHGTEGLSGCHLASPSLVLPHPEAAGHLAQVAAHQNHISSQLQRGKETCGENPRRADLCPGCVPSWETSWRCWAVTMLVESKAETCCEALWLQGRDEPHAQSLREASCRRAVLAHLPAVLRPQAALTKSHIMYRAVSALITFPAKLK